MQRPTTLLSEADRDRDSHATNVALVGLGSAAHLTLRALRDRADVRVVAAVDPLGETSSDLPSEARVVRHVDDLPDADIYIVSTPTQTHVEVCQQLLTRPCRPFTLMCEKPMALDLSDVVGLYDAAAARGVEFRGLLHYAFAPEVLWFAAERLEEVGPVESASCWFEDPYGHELGARASVLCSSWVDSGINALSVLDRLVRLGTVAAGDPAGVTASETVIGFRSAGVAGQATIVTRWGDGDAVKRTRLSVSGGHTVEFDHRSGTCSFDGVVAYQAPTPTNQARYDSMFDAHLGESGTVHSREELIALHALLDAGRAGFEGRRR